MLELLLVISVGCILSMASIPSYQHLLARNKTAHLINHVIVAMDAARSEAIAKGQVVAFCGSQDALHCDGQWQTGQVMLMDRSQQILRVYPGVSAGDRFWWQGSLGSNEALKFAPTGFTAGQRGSFYYCPRVKANQYGAKIVVSDSGRARIETDAQTLQKACAS